MCLVFTVDVVSYK